MKNYLYICGLSSENGMFWIRPVMADNDDEAKLEYIATIRNDKRLDFCDYKWDGKSYKNGAWFEVSFLSITKDILPPHTLNFIKEQLKITEPKLKICPDCINKGYIIVGRGGACRPCNCRK